MAQNYWSAADDTSSGPMSSYVMAPMTSQRTNETILNRTSDNNVTSAAGAGLENGGESIVLSEIIFVLDSYVTPFICAVGCIGNALSLTVLSRARFRQTDGRSESGAHIGLVFMAVSDLLLCVAMFPRALLPSIHLLFEEYDFRLLYQTYGTGVITTFILISTWITVDMTILRYFSICHPMLSLKWNSRRCALVVYPVSSVLCCLLNVPSFFQYQITDFSNDDGVFYMIDIGLMEPEAMKEFRYCQVVVGVIIPALVLIYCNVCLIQGLRRSHRIRIRSYVQDRNSQRSRKWITVTLVVISLGFIALVFPSELMDFFVDYIRMNNSRTESFLLARSLANALQVMNFALNFVVYIVINVHFRKTLQEMCRCRTPKQSPSLLPPSTSTMSSANAYSTRRVRLTQTVV